MRVISDEALDFISGGGASASSGSFGSSIPVVTIPGDGPGESQPTEEPPPIWMPPPIGGGGSTPISTPGSQPVSTPAPPACSDHHMSPPPPVGPQGVAIDDLRNKMLEIAESIKSLDNRIEHGAAVVRGIDGSLRIGEMNHGTAYDITISVGLRAGETVVGYLHSHPDSDVDQRFPSSYDFDRAAAFRKQVFVDSSMPIYILDIESGDVFEYHALVRSNTRTVGANISDDIEKVCPP